RMTGALWRSALVAALFAWRPLHVESVAWIAERKDVLSGFFWLLTMWAYLGYVRRLEARVESGGLRVEQGDASSAERGALKGERAWNWGAWTFYLVALMC